MNKIINQFHLLLKRNSILKLNQLNQYSSYISSKLINITYPLNTKYEVTNNPDEWNNVEQLLPRTLVPDPIKRDSYPSGWKPPGENLGDLPYYIGRTKNHMIPVYLLIQKRGEKRLTIIKKIFGDIWLFEKDIRPFLEDIHKPKSLRLQVNEFAGTILINGDFVNAIKYWLTQRNF